MDDDGAWDSRAREGVHLMAGFLGPSVPLVALYSSAHLPQASTWIRDSCLGKTTVGTVIPSYL